MTSTAAWQRLPAELKQYPQWALAGASKAPLSVDANGKLFNTGVTRPSEWLSFERAVAIAEAHKEHVTTHVDKKGLTVTQTGLNIGFILHESDPFTFIDLDVKDAVSHPDEPHVWTTPDQFDFYWNRVVASFDSYTELSRSGKGLHILLKGKIGAGFRRDGVEVYSQERFIICTGNIALDRPIMDRQAMLANMVVQMRPQPTKFELEELEEEEQDWSILTRAVNAANSDKFNALWKGDWQSLGYPSQSEADNALISMLAFYSKSNEQVRRLFRDSALGKREKAQKDNRYINTTLKYLRERQAREDYADLSAIVQASELVVQQEQAARSRTVVSMHAQAPELAAPVATPAPAAAVAAIAAPISAAVARAELDHSSLPWPPGVVGHIARFIYDQAPRPVKEVAIVSALGLMAGLTGKAWHIPQSGLNMYIILIARSAIGKEAMHSGISAIIKSCLKEFPNFGKFVDFSEFASGPALTKACVANPCFLNVSGEWGRRLALLAKEDGRDGPLQTLRTQMTNLYQKSGPAAIVGGISYSSTDNNVASVSGVSYSMIGETTPGTFYKALTDTMMEDGFLSRFLLVEYTGERPAENKYRVEYPDPGLVQAIVAMAQYADELINRDQSMPVGRTAEAAALMAQFEEECDRMINSTNDESRRQMWNRASLMSMRIAAQLAVAVNWLAPCITAEHVEWAQLIVRRSISIMRHRLDSGDVGADDTARERKLVSIIKSYLSAPVGKGYKIPDAMRQNGIVPRNYLQIRAGRTPTFSGHKFGSNRALDDTIKTLIDNGYLMNVQKDKVADAYNFHGQAYRVLKLPDYEEESHF